MTAHGLDFDKFMRAIIRVPKGETEQTQHKTKQKTKQRRKSNGDPKADKVSAG
jgi:hypothetical protein